MSSDDLIKIEEDKCIIKLDNLDEGIIKTIKKNVLHKISPDFFVSFLNEIKKNNGTYQFAHIPKGGKLKQYDDGTIAPVFRKENGNILEHGRLKKVGPDFVNISKIFANQIMMMRIMELLNEFNIKLDTIIKGQHDDRISEIEGAIKTYNSLPSEDKLDQNKTLPINLQINTGISKLCNELNINTNNINVNATFSDNWLSNNKNMTIKERHHLISEAIHWIIKGYGILIEWDVNFNVKKTHKENIKEFISFLENTKWNELKLFARGLPYEEKSKNIFPEDVWKNIHTRKDSIIKYMNDLQKSDHVKIYEYKISAKLLEILNEM